MGEQSVAPHTGTVGLAEGTGAVDGLTGVTQSLVAGQAREGLLYV